MNESIEDQIRKSLRELEMGHLSLDGFREWFVPISWNIERVGSFEAVELAHHIDGVLAEASSGNWTDTALREELVRPFVLLPAEAWRPQSVVVQLQDYPPHVPVDLQIAMFGSNQSTPYCPPQSLGNNANPVEELLPA